METITTKLYEGMFLVDAARAGSDWDGVISTIRKILDRVGAEIVSIKKWDDRKLAYDIKGQSRGVYILCYFRVDGTKIREIENSIHLSEQIMRVLILNAEQMTQEDIDKETPAAKAEQEGVKTEEETEVTVDQQSDDTDSEDVQEDEEDWDSEENEIESDDDTKDIEESEFDSNIND